MNERYEQMYRAATRYYVQGETMEAIAHGLDVSRSTVSRLLADARETGLVRITIAEGSSSQAPVARSLSDAFGVRVHLVALRGASPPWHASTRSPNAPPACSRRSSATR